MLEIALLGSISILAYIYVGYPLLAILLANVVRRPIDRGSETPEVTMIISAYNEEKHIAEKIRNVMALEYPRNLLDIVIASDASDDATDDIVRSHASSQVQLLRIEGRRGKTACQNAAAAEASGEILVFTDATTMLDPRALKAIVRNFHDSRVGCVAGRLVYVSRQDDATGRGGRSYWGYESILRIAESKLGSLIGVSGQLYAVRKEVYRPIAPDLISDFVIAMVVREQGLRTVLEPQAVCFEETLDRPDRELSMRVRVTLRSLHAIATKRTLLNPLRFGLFAWQLWSHKLMRYLAPLFLLTALVANIALAAQGQYVVLLLLQLTALAVGAVGFMELRVLRKSRLLTQPYYFLLTNVASAISLVRFAKGEKVVTWTPLR